VVGYQVFNALVTSSLRLDIDADPEVGPTTTLFAATNQHKIYLSQKSLDAAKLIINGGKRCFNQIYILSQLRQLQSQFSSLPLTPLATAHHCTPIILSVDLSQYLLLPVLRTTL
jgi:hypothetical protein